VRLSRRSALAGALALASTAGLSACTSGSSSQPPGPTQEPTPGADERARRTAAAGEQSLALLAVTVSARFAAQKALAARCRAAGAAHTAHSEALLEGLSPVASTSASSSSASSTSPSSSSPPPLPTSPQSAVAALTRAQSVAAVSHQDALALVSGPVARLLASVAASDLAQAATLRPLTAHPAAR
jgi:hypothetical protein